MAKSTRRHQTMPTQHGISPCPTVWVGFTNRLSVPFNRHFNETTFAVSSLCKSCKNQTPSSEVVLLVLDMTWTCRVKKAVLRVTKSMAVLIPIHGLSVLTDVYGCFNPSRKSIWLSVNHHRLRPIDQVTLLCCIGRWVQICWMHIDFFCLCSTNVKYNSSSNRWIYSVLFCSSCTDSLQLLHRLNVLQKLFHQTIHQIQSFAECTITRQLFTVLTGNNLLHANGFKSVYHDYVSSLNTIWPHTVQFTADS